MQRLKYVATDLITGGAAFFLFNGYRFSIFGERVGHTFADFVGMPKLLAEQIIIPLVLLCIYWLSGYYNHPFKKSRLQEFMTTIFSSVFATLLIFLALLTNDLTLIVSTNYLMLVTLFGILFSLTYAGRLLVTSLTLRSMRRHRWRESAVIVGASAEGREMAARLSGTDKFPNYAIVAFARIPGEKDAPDLQAPVVELDALASLIADKNVKQIFIAPEKMDDRLVLSMVNRLFPLGTTIRIAPDTLDYVTSSIHLQDIYAEPFVDLTSPKVSEASKNIKRLIDVVFSLIALAVLAIPMAWIAVSVKRGSKGPVLYRQQRIGYRQKPFNILKFRTMRIDAEAAGPQLTSDSDSRITPVGRTLRKYRLDELPQFWNVLRGDMSIVGPRPERAFFIRQIVDKAPYYTLVHQVRPGITSWGMVKYGYASSVDEMVARTRYDLIYLSNMSIAVDFKIMIYTVKTVVTGQGK